MSFKKLGKWCTNEVEQGVDPWEEKITEEELDTEVEGGMIIIQVTMTEDRKKLEIRELKELRKLRKQKKTRRINIQHLKLNTVKKM